MSVDNAKLVKLGKVSLAYSPVEDRILMTGQAEGDQSLEFWLTQRMCKQIIGVMVKKLAALGLKVSDSRNSPAVESFLQKRAVSARKPTTPISIKPSASYQPREILLQSNSKGLFLHIPVSSEEMAVLPFSHAEARQWLDMLYQKFEQAEWPLDLWPEWFKDKNSRQNPPSGQSFH